MGKSDLMSLIHATCVDLGGAAVLLRGPSGAGKSDLALRLIDGGGHLVADDQVILSAEEGILAARAPATIAGQIEVRGLGILRVPTVPVARIALVIDLVPESMMERMPESVSVEILTVTLPLLRLTPFEPSATAKVRFALARELVKNLGGR